MRKLLLISSSRTHGTGFLEHCRSAIKDHLEGVSKVLFVPFALADHDSYTRLASQSFREMGLGLDSLHQSTDPVVAVREAEAIFIGGGNTFRLLNELYQRELLEPIRQQVGAGMPYIGSSAGTNITAPTIRTTNDMPIVEPPSFCALNLVPFQINPHFIDANPESTHQGETREARLNEYLEENTVPVVGIREGCWLHVMDQQCQVQGERGGVLFQRDQPAKNLNTGDRLDFLLAG